MSLQQKLKAKYGKKTNETANPVEQTYVHPQQQILNQKQASAKEDPGLAMKYEELVQFNSSPEIVTPVTEVFPSRTQHKSISMPLGVFIRPYGCEVNLSD